MYLYVISDGTNVKIGISQDVRTRLNTMRVNNAAELEVVFKIDLGSLELALKMEQMLHQRYAKYKKRGEWYAIPRSLPAFDILYARDCADIFAKGVFKERYSKEILDNMSKHDIEEYMSARWPAPAPEPIEVPTKPIARDGWPPIASSGSQPSQGFMSRVSRHTSELPISADSPTRTSPYVEFYNPELTSLGKLFNERGPIKSKKGKK